MLCLTMTCHDSLADGSVKRRAPLRCDLPTRLIQLTVLALFACLACQSATAQLPAFELRGVSQCFLAAGSESDFSITQGTHNSLADRLLFSDPGIVAQLKQGATRAFDNAAQPSWGQFKVKVTPEVKPGRYEVRAGGRFGLSNPRAVIVAPHVHALTTPPHDINNPPSLAIDTVHCRQTAAAKRERYRLQAEAGKTYRLAVFCSSIDSELIPVIEVVSQQGNTLLRKFGNDRSDLTVDFSAIASEPVTVCLYDALYRGGPTYHYGLLVEDTTQPLEWTEHVQAFPPSAISRVDLPSELTAEISDATTLTIPAAIRAHFDHSRDRDQYLLKLSQGQAIDMHVLSDRINQPTNVRMLIEQPQGEGDGQTWKRIATVENGQNVTDSVIRLQTRDPIHRFTAPAEATYRITLIDLDNGQSLSSVQDYGFFAAPASDRFQLLAYHTYPHKDAKTSRPHGFCLRKHESCVVRVFALRTGEIEPIKITVDNLPDSLTCTETWIASNQSQADLIITAKEDIDAATIPLNIVGQSINGDSTSPLVAAKPAVVQWPSGGSRTSPTTRLTDQLIVQTQPLDTMPVQVTLAPGQEKLQIQKGKPLNVKLQIKRAEGGKNNIVLRARNLPADTKAGDLTIPGDKTEIEWKIEVGGKAFPGTYSFWGQGETKLKLGVHPEVHTAEVQYLEHLKALRAKEETKDQHAELDKQIAATTKRVADLQKQTQPKDYTVYLAGPAITLEITP